MAHAIALKKRYGHFAAPPMSAVLFEPSEGWWVASFPGVDGAYSQGKTKQSAYNNLLDAMSGLEALRREGLIK
jgi:predicted RNase H-like HicB family nuclease